MSNTPELDQAEYCRKNELPHFAPGSGVCFDCRINIYEHKWTREHAGDSLITACPHCRRSFCD